MTSPDNQSGVPLPVVGSPTEFPFRVMSDVRFERLCQDVAKAHGFTNVHRYGKPGQPEHGVDFRGTSPQGHLVAFQARQTAAVTASQLRDAVKCFSDGPLAEGVHTFVLCMSVEANDRNFQNKLNKLQPQYPFEIEVWDSPELTRLLRDQESLVQTYFGRSWVTAFFGPDDVARRRLNSEALLLGPIEALGLAEKVEKAERLAKTSQADAARVYGEVADDLRERFPGHADRFEQLSATALRESGDASGSHDLLMDLAIRDLFDRAQPQVSPGVSQGLHEVHNSIDETRQARSAAMIYFGRWHEDRTQLQRIAECFDVLKADDRYAPFIAVLLVEAALADRNFQVVLDREDRLREIGESGDTKVALRVRVALADAGIPGNWDTLMNQAESLLLPTPEGMYVLLRAARWCAWNGRWERTATLYRHAMKLGAEANLDLDVENALWSLTSLYRFPAQFEEFSETNQLALSIDGTCSFVKANPRTRQRAYLYLATDQKPNAHLWSRFHLLESIRSGCLSYERESHTILARIHVQSGNLMQALEHAVLSGEFKLVEEIAPRLNSWPVFLTDALTCSAPWMIPTALSALDHVGDLAPPELARGLVTELVDRLVDSSDGMQDTQALLKALGAIILAGTNDDLQRLMPLLGQLAPRKDGEYRMTDDAVLILAARVYRFRSDFRQQAAEIFGEMAVGSHSSVWSYALESCGDDIRELIEALERVADRVQLDLTRALAQLGHLNAATRAHWTKLLQFVANHPLGQRSSYDIGSKYYVPEEFLKEQSNEVVRGYVDKLIEIGLNPHEPSINRGSALAAAANAVDLLTESEREELGERVQPLTDHRIQISETDQLYADSQHPLSRFHVSLGGATDVRVSAAWLLGQAFRDSEQRSFVIKIALNWLRSEDAELQRTGASLLTLPRLSTSKVSSNELATHTNPEVRRIALQMPDMKTSPDTAILAALASDPDRDVRIGVVYALPRLRTIDPDPYEDLRVRLDTDPSALVRALAAEELVSSDRECARHG